MDLTLDRTPLFSVRRRLHRTSRSLIMIRLSAPARPAYLRVVRASAWYDLAVTAGFMTPWTYALVHEAISSLGDALGWGVLPELDPWQTLYANLMGSVVVVWATLRVVRPLPVH